MYAQQLSGPGVAAVRHHVSHQLQSLRGKQVVLFTRSHYVAPAVALCALLVRSLKSPSTRYRISLNVITADNEAKHKAKQANAQVSESLCGVSQSHHGRVGRPAW